MSKCFASVPAPLLSGQPRGAAADARAPRAHVRHRRSIHPTATERPAVFGWKALRRIPLPAFVCGLVACLNAVSWSFITPPFEVPDEPSHFAYVKQLAETGTRPTSSAESFSTEELNALGALRFAEVKQSPANPAVFSQAEQNRLDEVLQASRQLPERGSRDAGVATSQPPLYYALESIPYLLGSSGTLLDRLQLMRLLSSLMAGLTAAFTFMFLREALPRVRWAWTVGALAVALSPLLGFSSGGVTPDAMLFAVTAALFYCLARAFRRGLTSRSAFALGLVIVIGLLSKLNFVGLAPGAFLALGILTVRGVRRHGRAALGAPVSAAALGVAPVVGFLVSNVLSHQATFGIATDTLRHTHGSLAGAADYIWQLYLPRLPGTPNDFPGLFTPIQVWFDGYVGRFGWFDTFFPGWVYAAALVAAAAIAGLCARALVSDRAALRARLAELAVYATMTLGLLVLVGADSYRDLSGQLAAYGQTRYLLPMLPLLGAVVALAARGAGRRWGPATGTLIVVLFLAHDLFSQLQTVARYYG